jgi:hypothetical protein
MFKPWLRRLRLLKTIAPPALENLSLYYQLHLH